MAAEHLGWLVDCVFDLHSNSTTSLRFLNNLIIKLINSEQLSDCRVHLVSLVIYFKRCSVSCWGIKGREEKLWSYILPRSIISFCPFVGFILTTARGVPTRRLPSRISTPTMMGSRLQNVAMIFNRQGQIAWGAASRRLASTISWLYAVKESKRW